MKQLLPSPLRTSSGQCYDGCFFVCFVTVNVVLLKQVADTELSSSSSDLEDEARASVSGGLSPKTCLSDDR